jgi:uracil-DNA glycosylase
LDGSPGHSSRDGAGWFKIVDWPLGLRRTLVEMRKSASQLELARIARSVEACQRCPRLVAWCREVARTRRRAFASEDYWGRPVPGFGDGAARIWILGLAPAAHGGNRTGRVFTGDRSGDFLYAALHRVGLANQSRSVSRDDGLVLTGVYISAAGRCAPPENKPTPKELANCREWLDRELAALARLKVIVALGGIAWDAALAMLARNGQSLPRPRPRFGHAAEVAIGNCTLLGCYHVSQQNTFTGRLTERMIDQVLARAKAIAAAQV